MIVGASFDTIDAQKHFAEEQGFPYALLADTTKALGQDYEVDQPDKGWPRRVTYLIDPAGTIVRTYDMAGQDLEVHAQEVLEDIRRLSAP